MSDKRKDVRKKLMAFTTVYDSISRSLLGYVGNINMLGLMIISEHPLEIGREVMLNIEFPKSLAESGDKNLVTPARVAWCNQDSSVKSYTIGFEFTKLAPEQAETIRVIMERYEFRHNDL